MSHSHPHPHQHAQAAAPGPANAPAPIPDELITLHQLSYDPATLTVSSLSPDDADPGFLQELQYLNYAIKTITATNDNPQPLPQGIPPQFQMKEYIPPPPRPVPNIRSNAIAQKKEEGNAAFRLHKYPEAIKQYTFSAALSATRPTFESAQYSRDELSIALCNRSAAYAADGKWIEALADANAVIGLKKNWTKGHFRKGKALLGLKQYEEARQAILLGLEFEPANEDLATVLDEIDKAVKEQYKTLKIEA